MMMMMMMMMMIDDYDYDDEGLWMLLVLRRSFDMKTTNFFLFAKWPI